MERRPNRKAPFTEEEKGDTGHDSTGGLRWLLTYADMITLLLAFFIILYAISATNTQRFNEFATAVKQGFSIFPAEHYKTREGDAPVLQNRNPMETLDSDLSATLSKEISSGNIKISQGPEGITISVADSLLFEPEQAELSPAAEELLKKVAALLSPLTGEVVVEGHTDNIPVQTTRFPSNWELSSARAVNVVKNIINGGIAPGRLSAVGFGEFRPRVPNDPLKGAPENRRIDILIRNTVPKPVIQSEAKPSLSGAYFQPFTAPQR
ncbi:MAG: OmpA family protein [Nitrospirota bacterium]|nr:OmpA family protein [Nitrospirota bacterium]